MSRVEACAIVVFGYAVAAKIFSIVATSDARSIAINVAYASLPSSSSTRMSYFRPLSPVRPPALTGHTQAMLTLRCSFRRSDNLRRLALVPIVHGSDLDHRMIDDDAKVSFEQMKGAVGSLIFLWSQIERALEEASDALKDDDPGGSKPAHGIARKLDFWSCQIRLRNGRRKLASKLTDVLTVRLREALSVRNLVCHGLIGISAKIHPDGNEAHLTVELGDIRKNLTWTELQFMFQWLSQARWLIRDLTSASLEPDDLRAEKILIGWQGFPDFR